MRFLEVKRHLDKPDGVFVCRLISREAGSAVLAYVSDRPWHVGDVEVLPGSTTYAWYREGKGFVVWKMHGPDGRLLGHLFHLCRDLQVGPDRVEYLDLMLDLWFSPDGRCAVLDREDLETYRKKGLVGEEDLAWIERWEGEVRRGFLRTTKALDALLGQRGIPG